MKKSFKSIIVVLSVVFLCAITCEIKSCAYEDWFPEEIFFTEEKNCIKVSPLVNGNVRKLEYKFYWKKANEEGLISDFSSGNEIEWKPSEVGDYTVYIEIRDEQGESITISRPYKVAYKFDLIFKKTDSAQFEFKVESPDDFLHNQDFQYDFSCENIAEKATYVPKVTDKRSAVFTPPVTGEYVAVASVYHRGNEIAKLSCEPIKFQISDHVVGLENYNASCYLNSVIQQINNITSLRDGIIAADMSDSDMKIVADGAKALLIKMKEAPTTSVVPTEDIYKSMSFHQGAADPSETLKDRFLPWIARKCSDKVLCADLTTGDPININGFVLINKFDPIHTDADNVVVSIASIQNIEKTQIQRIPAFVEINNFEIRSLRGFIVSTAIGGGHYYSFLNINNNWYCVNDSVVQFVGGGEMALERVFEMVKEENLFISMAFYSR